MGLACVGAAYVRGRCCRPEVRAAESVYTAPLVHMHQQPDSPGALLMQYTAMARLVEELGGYMVVCICVSG